MQASPLDSSGLRAIDDCLSAGELEEAQRLLAMAGVEPEHEHATTYLATRLLYLRERLDPESVVLRLRELLQNSGHFPEATALLRVASAGIPGKQSVSAMAAIRPPSPAVPPPATSPSSARGPSPAAFAQTAEMQPLRAAPSSPPSKQSTPPDSFGAAASPLSARPTMRSEPAEDLDHLPAEWLESELPAADFSERPPAADGPPPSGSTSAASSPPASDSPGRRIEVDTRASSSPHLPSHRSSRAPPPPPNWASSRPKPAGRYALREPGSDSVTPPPSATRRSAPAVTETGRMPTIPRAPTLPRVDPPAAPPPSSRQVYQPADSRPMGSAARPYSASVPPAARGHVAPGAGRYAVTRSEPPAAQRAAPKSAAKPRSATTTAEVKTGAFRVPRPGSLASSAPPSASSLPPTTVSAPEPSIPPVTTPLPAPEKASEFWPDVEVQLFEGRRAPVLDYLERTAAAAMHQLSSQELTTYSMARAAAALLTEGWVTHHFAPFDLSLHSLARLDMALDAVFGFERTASLRPTSRDLARLLGAYLGETLRVSHRGNWEGELSESSRLVVRAGAHVWSPFVIVERRILSGGKPPLTASLEPGLAHQGTQAWMAHELCPKRVPLLWTQLPGPHNMPELGAAMCKSIYSLACAQKEGLLLDRSEDSLSALDSVVDVLVATATPLNGKEPWLQRLAVLVGAYTGEVLRVQAGGDWQAQSGVPLADRYYLKLPNGLEATPAANVVARAVAGKASQLRGYVRAMLRRSATR